MKARPNKPKILMMTAQRDPGTIMQAIEQGAVGYLVKPFKPLDLLKRVDAALRGPIAAPSLATPAVLDELILD
jgi:DNA-binding response OmpR family regulator